MLRKLTVVIPVSMLVMLAHPARSGDQPAKPAASSAARAPALTSAQAARLATLQRLSPPDPKFKVAKGVLPVFKATTVKKEVSCGVWVYPPNPNPNATSTRIFWVNTTGHPLPVGTSIEWEVEGYPANCCKGVNGPLNFVWQPNPPTINYVYSTNPELYPPQPWTRGCKAWAIVP